MRAKSAERIKAEKYIIKHPSATAGELTLKCGVALATAYKVLEEASQLQVTEFKPQEHNIIQGYTGKQYELVDTSPIPFTTEEQIADVVNNPAHYTVGGIETIDFIEAKNLNYRLGNAVKYISRADHKGNRLENLKKAQWYLNREIERYQEN